MILISHATGSNDHLHVSYRSERNEIHWDYSCVFDRNTNETTDHWGDFAAEEWLNAIGTMWTIESNWVWQPEHWLAHGASVESVAKAAHEMHPSGPPALFLDSFSIIENGEMSQRVARTVEPSVAQRTLISLAQQGRVDVGSMTPREFEAFVARVLSEMGFSKVELRRYVKDSGIDIVAILADGANPETVVVEVKRSTGTLAMLDRINGVRDREHAERALLVSSCHITRAAEMHYACRSDQISAKTINEIVSLLKDSPDWSTTARKLWTKK